MKKLNNIMEKEIKYLIFVIREESLPIIEDKLIMGFKPKFKKSLKKLSVGDRFLFYIKGMKLRGTYTINSKLFIGEEEIFKGNLYPLRFKIKKDGKIKNKPFIHELIEKLEFITNKEHWSSHVMGKSCIQISEQDFRLLEKYLNEE